MSATQTIGWAPPQSEPDNPSLLKTITSYPTLLLYLAAVLYELLIGILIYYRVLPGSLRILGDAVVLAMLGLTIGRMLVEDRFPQVTVFLLGVTLLGATVATFNGQSAAATLWGWWTMFKYPMVALYVYLCREWPSDFARWYYRFCFAVLGFEVIVQFLQFAAGEPPGDNLTGTFGRQSTHTLSTFIFLTLGLAIGYWLVYKDWKILGYVALASMIASVLAALRFFPIGATIFIAMGGLLYLLRGEKVDRSILFFGAAILALVAFPIAYNRITAETREIRTWQETVSDTERTGKYLNGIGYDADAGVYRIGRNFAVRYGWRSLQENATVFLFGYGTGARAFSDSLGIIGSRNQYDILGALAGPTSITLIEELGVLGLSMLFLFLLWMAANMWRCARSDCPKDLRVMAIGLLLFTLFWPVHFWYNRAWDYASPMLLYWGGIGYVFGAFHQCRHQTMLPES